MKRRVGKVVRILREASQRFAVIHVACIYVATTIYIILSLIASLFLYSTLSPSYYN